MSDASLWITTLLAAIISLVAIYFAVSPLLKPGKATLVLDDDKYIELLGRKDATLQAIKDLEFDYRVGKISQEDFQRLDQRLRRQAIGLLQQLEKMAPATATLDKELESLITHFRKTSVAPALGTSTVVIDNTLAAIPPRQATCFCIQCGKPVESGHKFCAYCGKPITQPDPHTTDHMG